MALKNKVTDIFFDLDHTLWDFEKNSALTFKKIFSQHSVQLPLEEFLAVYVPINFEYWKLYREERISKEELRYSRLKKTFDGLNFNSTDELINRLSHDYIQRLPDNDHLFEGAIEILEYLKPSYKLHIITNGFREVQRVKMETSKIKHYFDKIVDSESVGVKKPNPLIFEFALKSANVRSKNALMIGDNIEADIEGASKVGMQSIHFEPDPNNQKADFHISSLLQLKNYL
ncbi:YjjG family noncanonical pyrimidine nucleotidase [Spongiivirga citrea]|uniref:YjjG family noncanonical pyrimidine nucleotidase n=1 Tax=Spongiivirga citrea TaxID=1481457 RepID=UPI001EF81CC8|nr:YjjG family noncanonical pyrimidine nucleotidase [Spongiivirga citrea]